MSSNFIIRLIDQSGIQKDRRSCKSYYGDMTEEQFKEICIILNISDEDFE